MQGEVIAPDGDDERDAQSRVGGQHALVGNPQGVDEVGLNPLDETAQATRIARQASTGRASGGWSGAIR